jgi:hypothetical protein
VVRAARVCVAEVDRALSAYCSLNRDFRGSRTARFLVVRGEETAGKIFVGVVRVPAAEEISTVTIGRRRKS